MLDYVHLQTLAEVLRAGSFEEAAARLGVTPSAVSQRIRALEERLGAVLVRRGPPATATEMGARIARHAEDVALMERDLLDGFGQAPEERPVIRLAVSADSLATWVLPALAQFDGPLFDLVIDDQDHSADWLKRGEVMAAISAHDSPIAGCDSYPLGSLRYLPCASPAFVARWFPAGVTAESLGAAPALIFNSKNKLEGRWAKAVTGKRVALRGHTIASAEGFRTAARLSLGWGMIPEAMVGDDLARRSLVALIPGTPLDVPLHWQVSRLPGAALPRLTKAIRQAARAVLVAA
jgi:LysR family transcriptional regulator, chromosome initiation inhibitor